MVTMSDAHVSAHAGSGGQAGGGATVAAVAGRVATAPDLAAGTGLALAGDR